MFLRSAFFVAVASSTVGVTQPSRQAQPFELIAPLECANPRCTSRYTEGAYTAQTITSVLDHSLVLSRSSGFYQYGKRPADSDGRVVAFNGETAAGRRHTNDPTCIEGTIRLPLLPPRTGMYRVGGCPSGYASYDEHPGYDYVAAIGTPVRAAAAGTVFDYHQKRCVETNIPSCEAMGYVGIDHGNGYITQYGHLSQVSVTRGQRIRSGQQIGLSGDTGVRGSPHLHFEVLYKDRNVYYIVDPYGWVGPGRDPLYSRSVIAPRKLWR